MLCINRAQLLGYAAGEPAAGTTARGAAMATFRVATHDRKKTADGGSRDDEEWHQVVAYGQVAEIACQLVRKGDVVYVEGKIERREVSDADSRRLRAEIVLRDRDSKLSVVTPSKSAAGRRLAASRLA